MYVRKNRVKKKNVYLEREKRSSEGKKGMQQIRRKDEL
jgi:hypothetical protein